MRDASHAYVHPRVMTASHDAIVIGAGVFGVSIAYHLAALGAKNVVVLDRGAVGSGTE